MSDAIPWSRQEAGGQEHYYFWNTKKGRTMRTILYLISANLPLMALATYSVLPV